MSESKLTKLLNQCIELSQQQQQIQDGESQSFQCKYGILNGLKLEIKDSDHAALLSYKEQAKNIEYNVNKAQKERIKSWRKKAHHVEQSIEKKRSSRLKDDSNISRNLTTGNDNTVTSSVDSNENYTPNDGYQSLYDSYASKNMLPLSLESVNFKDIIARSNSLENLTSNNHGHMVRDSHITDMIDGNSHTKIKTPPKAFSKSIKKSPPLPQSTSQNSIGSEGTNTSNNDLQSLSTYSETPMLPKDIEPKTRHCHFEEIITTPVITNEESTFSQNRHLEEQYKMSFTNIISKDRNIEFNEVNTPSSFKNVQNNADISPLEEVNAGDNKYAHDKVNADISPVNKLNIGNDITSTLDHNMKSLHTLQHQQDELDQWYLNMQKQLELEKLKMAEKYDELKLKNIREQQKLIDRSHEAINQSNVSNRTPVTLGRSKLATPNVEHDINSHQPLARNKQLYFDKSNIEMQSSPVTCDNNKSHTTVDISEHQKVHSTAPQHVIHKESDICGNNKSRVSNLSSSGPLNTIPTVEALTNDDNYLKDLRDRRKSRPIKFFSSPAAEQRKAETKYEDCLLDNSVECLEVKQRLASTPQERNNELSSQIEFKSPLNEPPQNVSRSPYRSMLYDKLNNSRRKDLNLTSTPHHYVEQASHNLSRLPLNTSSQQNASHHRKDLGKDFSSAILTEADLCRLRDILVSVVKAFLVRRLMKTNKVDSIIKTIKDTKLCLCDMNKENSLRMSQISKADQQLKARLEDELKSKRELFYAIFFKYTPQEQMKILSQARLQKQEKLIQATSKSSKASVKLSSASQRSIQRRKDDNNRPKTAPGYIESPKKKEKEIAKRPLRPIQSCFSPILSERIRPRTADSTKSAKKVATAAEARRQKITNTNNNKGNHANNNNNNNNKPVNKVLVRKTTVAKKLTMTTNVAKKDAISRVMAAEFKKRTNSKI